MTDTNQLPPHTITIRDHPEPHIMQWSDLELAAVKRYAEQYALQARAQVQGEPFGYIHHFDAHDERGALIDTTWEADGCADPLPHPTFPAMWKWSHCTPFYTTPQPAQATQTELTDEQILEIAEPFGEFQYGDAQGHKRIDFARAILSLRPERAPMTDEQISLEAHNADDRDWNDLRYRSSWHEGFLEGARFAEAHHGITTQAKKETP